MASGLISNTDIILFSEIVKLGQKYINTQHYINKVN